MSQPRRSQRLAGRRVEPVPVPLDSDSDSLSIGIRCEVCGSEDPGVVSRVAILLPIDNASLVMQKFRAPLAVQIFSQCLTLSPARVLIGHHVAEILGIVWSARKL